MSMRTVVLASLAMLAACSGREPSPPGSPPVLSPMLERRSDGTVIASADSLRRIPGYVVDSIFPPAEALIRFRTASSQSPATALSGGETSITKLFTGYVAALHARDSIAVLRFALTRAEYAWLYYDGSPEQKSGLVPEAAWALMESRSNVGLGRAASRVASLADAHVVSASCGQATTPLPTSELLGPCFVVLASPEGNSTRLLLARTVMRRNGRVKLVSFANGL